MSQPIKQFTNGDKYYNLYIHPTIFGEISLVCSWGSSKSKRGGSKTFFFNNQNELNKKITEISKRRKSRGYEVMYHKYDV